METEAEVLEPRKDVVADVVGGLLGDSLGEVVLGVAEYSAQCSGEEYGASDEEELGEGTPLLYGAFEGLVDGGAGEPGHGEAGGDGQGHCDIRADDEGLVSQSVTDESKEYLHVWGLYSCRGVLCMNSLRMSRVV